MYMSHVETPGEHQRDCGHHGGEAECCPPGRAKVRGFTHCWLLLQLAHAPAHGYELLERTGEAEDALGFDPGFLYRTLRGFEEGGLVNSAWDTTGTGPARRVYAITDMGREHLHAWAVHLRHTRDRLSRFLSEYESLPPEERR